MKTVIKKRRFWKIRNKADELTKQEFINRFGTDGYEKCLNCEYCKCFVGEFVTLIIETDKEGAKIIETRYKEEPGKQFGQCFCVVRSEDGREIYQYRKNKDRKPKWCPKDDEG